MTTSYKSKAPSNRVRFKDAIFHNAERVKTARNNDVIFGRGKGFQNCPGNVRMRGIIKKHKDHYKSLERSAKRDFVKAVYEEIIEGGARFLTKLSDEDNFAVVEASFAINKVSNTLRCKKSCLLNRSNKSTDNGNLPSERNEANAPAILQALHLDRLVAIANSNVPTSAPTTRFDPLINRAMGHTSLEFGEIASDLMLGQRVSPLMSGISASSMASRYSIDLLHSDMISAAAIQRRISRLLPSNPLLAADMLHYPSAFPPLVASLPQSSLSFPPSMDAYDCLIRERLIRDNLLSQQLGGVNPLMNPRLTTGFPPLNLGGAQGDPRMEKEEQG
jgi:hypothetical protein